jgi:hypothetical protein
MYNGSSRNIDFVPWRGERAVIVLIPNINTDSISIAVFFFFSNPLHSFIIALP